MQGLRTILLAAALAATSMVATAAPMVHAPTSADARHAGDLVFDAIGNRRLVMIGELHGTQETPALVGDVLDHFAARDRGVVLALEVSTQEQPRFDRYLASRGTAADRTALLEGAHWREVHHDGRDSKAMLDLIEHVRRLRTRGAPVALVAFDGGGTDMDTRNLGMAKVLRATAKRFPTSTLLVLTGNVHAMTRRPTWEMVSDGKPIAPPMTAGRALADLSPMSIDVRGATGAFWACVDGGCGARSLATPDAPRPAEARLTRNATDDAWEDTLTLPHLTPSSPAIVSTTSTGSSGRAVRP